MLNVDVVPAESARYTASLIFVPGLWSGPRGWRRSAGYLAHRGWECHLVDPRGHGGIAGRAAAVAEYAAALPVRPLLLGHDAGALVALAAAGPAGAAAAVLVAPLVPGSRETHVLLPRHRALVGALLRRPLAPPSGVAASLLWGELTAPLRRQLTEGGAGEDVALVRDLRAGRVLPPRPPGMPLLLLGGARDALLPAVAARALAATLAAEHDTLPGAGHWPHLDPTTWQPTVDRLHRWLVQRLGEKLLELYAEAMAERETDDE